MPDILRLDYETRSEKDIKAGTDAYMSHPSTQAVIAGWSINDSPPRAVDITGKGCARDRLPAELYEALKDPHVQKRAFNATFERVATFKLLGIRTHPREWRCTMVKAYALGFSGSLGQVGAQMQIPLASLKDKRGTQLIRMFSQPQTVKSTQPHRWRNALTDPEEWDEFVDYCRQDVAAESAIDRRASAFFIPESEWDLYALDQEINDRGLYIDREFVIRAIDMVKQRKQEVLKELREFTGLPNPGSDVQMKRWLQDRGYPFDDLAKATVEKVVREKDQNGLEEDAVKAIEMREIYQKRSVTKYNTMITSMGADRRFRYTLQMNGAQRTGRFAGRKLQGQNLPRTPKIIESDPLLSFTTQAIKDGQYELVKMTVGEPMLALQGLIRSAIGAPPGRRLVVCDLSSIETAVIAWLAKCDRLLQVFADGRCPYRDFATSFFKVPYDQTLGYRRTQSKPAVLGCGYRLGGGELRHGKRTGLWGYAENMGVEMSQEAAKDAVGVYRSNYPEVVSLWFEYERAVEKCLKTKQDQIVGWVTFRYNKPFLTCRLPSGRFLYYFQPQIKTRIMPPVVDEDGRLIRESYKKQGLVYKGRQDGAKWGEIDSHGGKMVENIVQAIARDILVLGMRRAKAKGFEITGHVHDEIITEADEDDTVHGLDLLRKCMVHPISWAPGLPLGAAGWEGTFYRKD